MQFYFLQIKCKLLEKKVIQLLTVHLQKCEIATFLSSVIEVLKR
jgi:hypothetical protein